MSAPQIPETQKVSLFRKNGGPEVIEYTDYPVPEINDYQVLIKNKYSGINFIESYFRSGLYPSSTPYVMGREASGTVVAKGSKVTKFDVGDKVAYMGTNTFAQYTSFPAEGRILKLADDASDDELAQIAAVLVNGLTALTFITEAYEVKKGDYILVHAIAGGCGLIFAQLLKKKGAIVIGTASSDEKLALGKEYGADYLINYKTQDVVEEVLKITDGAGVPAVYDGIGAATFEVSFASLARKGTLISFGNASGPVPPLTISRLSPKNLKILRPQAYGYLAPGEEWEKYSSELRSYIKEGLKINITKVFPLSEYKEATTLLESGKTTGKLLLSIPE